VRKNLPQRREGREAHTGGGCLKIVKPRGTLGTRGPQGLSKLAVNRIDKGIVKSPVFPVSPVVRSFETLSVPRPSSR
jgi:hypothetical protein